MTPDRFVHGIVAALFLVGFLSVRQPKGSVLCFLAVVVGALLGSWIPDWDLVGGIGNHRSPVTHSALPAALLLIFGRQYRVWRWLIIGTAIGIASHLVWDSVNYGNVIGIPGRTLDILFLLGNSAFSAGIAFWLSRGSSEMIYLERLSKITDRKAEARAHIKAEKQNKRATRTRKRRTKFNVVIFVLVQAFLTLMFPFILLWEGVKSIAKALRQDEKKASSDISPVANKNEPKEIDDEVKRPKGIAGLITTLLTVLMWLFLFPVLAIRAIINGWKKT